MLKEPKNDTFGNQTVNRYVISKTWWFNEVESVPNKQIYKHADTTRPRKLCQCVMSIYIFM